MTYPRTWNLLLLALISASAGCHGEASLTIPPDAGRDSNLTWASHQDGASLPHQSPDGATAPPPDGGGAAPQDGPPTVDALLDAAAVEAPSARVVVLSGLNGAYGATSYSSAVHNAVAAITGQIKPDLVLITGGMVAGQKVGLDHEAMWAAFHAAVTDPLTLAGIPLAVAPGNHDASGYIAYATERQIFVDQWKARTPAVDQMVDASNYPLGYSFIHRGVFFLSIDATMVGPLKPPQLSLIDQRLAVAGPPLRIVFGHLPIHPVAEELETEILGDDALEQLLGKHQVALYLSGHHHGYYPGVAGGLRQIAVGCLGAGARKLIGTSAVSELSLVVIEILSGKIASVEAYAGDAFDQVVARSSLPSKVVHGTHELTRDDLAGL